MYVAWTPQQPSLIALVFCCCCCFAFWTFAQRIVLYWCLLLAQVIDVQNMQLPLYQHLLIADFFNHKAFCKIDEYNWVYKFYTASISGNVPERKNKTLPIKLLHCTTRAQKAWSYLKRRLLAYTFWSKKNEKPEVPTSNWGLIRRVAMRVGSQFILSPWVPAPNNKIVILITLVDDCDYWLFGLYFRHT